MNDKMECLNSKIELAADYLYQENKEQGYKGVSEIIKMISDILGNDIKENMMDAISLAVSAMEQEDLTLLADVLIYEIATKLK